MGIHLPDELCVEAVRLRAESRTDEEAASKATDQRTGMPGIARSSFLNRLLKAAQRGLDGDVPRPIPPGQIIKGVSTLYDAGGNKVLQWVKTRDDSSLAELTDAMREAFADIPRASITPPPGHTDAELLSVYPIADVHHGLLAWGLETGEDYDLKIGSARLRSCLGALVAQAPPSQNALLLNLGDFFHSNDGTSATPASKHRLDVDGRFFKVVTTGVRLFLDCIDLALQKHEHITVVCIPGNHDPESTIALIVALSAFYHDEPRVTIVESPAEFYYQRFGATLIGACHGHRVKPQAMAMDMAMTRAEEWALARYRWFVFGHIHHETLMEVGNVRCESFQTVAGRDAYAAGHAYHAGRSLSSITLHVERGEIGRHRVNLESVA